MKPTTEDLYERYLTAFSCSASGAVCRPGVSDGKDNGPGEAEALEAAQALGTLDGLTCRQSPQTNPGVIRLKRQLLGAIAHLLGTPVAG